MCIAPLGVGKAYDAPDQPRGDVGCQADDEMPDQVFFSGKPVERGQVIKLLEQLVDELCDAKKHFL